MILIAVVAMGMMFGMPYLMENSKFLLLRSTAILVKTKLIPAAVDPEMKEEFEAQSKKSMLTGGAKHENPLKDFDMAAWMAGTGKKEGSASSGTAPSPAERGGNAKRR